jgi:hypothetical protein
MKNWNSVEEKWREQLQNKSEDIPEDLWSRLEERLVEKPAKRFPIYWAAAAMLLLAVGLSWVWNEAPESTDQITHPLSEVKKASAVRVQVAASATQPALAPSNAREPKINQANVEPSSPIAPMLAYPEEKPQAESIVSTTVAENKIEPEEVLTVRLDIDPVADEEEVKPTVNQQKRRKSFFGKIVGEIRQALDGETVNWQKLKEGNANFENRIHTVANTYVKTEENLKRTLQIQ